MSGQGEKLSTEVMIVTVNNPDGTLKDQKKKYKVVKFPKEVPTATIEAAVGATINVGNYQSLRVDCRVTRNCVDSPEAIGDMRKALFKDVMQHLDEAIEEAKEHF